MCAGSRPCGRSARVYARRAAHRERGFPHQLVARHRAARPHRGTRRRRRTSGTGHPPGDGCLCGDRCPGVRGVIIETIVTTMAADGEVNCAPMGVEWNPALEPETIVLKPFLETATYRNVSVTRAAVINLIDDVRVFAKAAISNPTYHTVPAQAVQGAVLADACSWRELEVTSIDS